MVQREGHNQSRHKSREAYEVPPKIEICNKVL